LKRVTPSVDERFTVRASRNAVIVSFPAPARILSWALLNGGFCRGDHIVNHYVDADNLRFCARPRAWLEEAAVNLGLEGTTVAMATAVSMKHLAQVSIGDLRAQVTCLATVGCGNALAAGDPASVAITESTPALLHTINMIVLVQPALCDEALVEAIQIATEGRARALYEARVPSSVSNLPASGTGTDCIVIASLGAGPGVPYCGKHTELGEFIGRAAHAAVQKGLALSSAKHDGAHGD
jgi:adenosylcobinamide amidohydrolase